jgi:hypothetical protein
LVLFGLVWFDFSINIILLKKVKNILGGSIRVFLLIKSAFRATRLSKMKKSTK